MFAQQELVRSQETFLISIMVYGAIFFTIVFTWLIGKSLDKRHSTESVKWKTGCISMKTLIQSLVLGLVVGPVVYFLKHGKEELWWCVLCMMAAPFIVDLLRPTVTFQSPPDNVPAQPEMVRATRQLKMAHILAIVICVGAIGGFVVYSFMC